MNRHFAPVGEQLANKQRDWDLVDRISPTISQVKIVNKSVKASLVEPKPSKATGLDGVASKLLKAAAPKIVVTRNHLQSECKFS